MSSAAVVIGALRVKCDRCAFCVAYCNSSANILEGLLTFDYRESSIFVFFLSIREYFHVHVANILLYILLRQKVSNYHTGDVFFYKSLTRRQKILTEHDI